MGLARAAGRLQLVSADRGGRARAEQHRLPAPGVPHLPAHRTVCQSDLPRPWGPAQWHAHQGSCGWWWMPAFADGCACRAAMP